MSIKNISDYTRLAEVSYVNFSEIKDLKNNIDRNLCKITSFPTAEVRAQDFGCF